MKYLVLSEKLERDLYLLNQENHHNEVFKNLYNDFENIRDTLEIKNWAEFARDFGFLKEGRASFTIAISQLEEWKKNVNFFQKKSLEDIKIIQKSLQEVSIVVLDSLSLMDVEINKTDIKGSTLGEVAKEYNEAKHGTLRDFSKLGTPLSMQ